MISRKKAFIYMCKIAVVCIAFSFLLLLLFAMFWQLPSTSVILAEGTDRSMLLSVVIDAGHGGRDGGAVSASGILEKDLNLEMSNALRDMLMLCGVDVVMTRTEDRLACDENDPALKGKLKMNDLKNRLMIAEEHPEAVFVSIHMNNFPIEKYSGLQIYYSRNHTESYPLAKAIQENVHVALQKQNDRKVKPAGGNIFLLDRITSPAILIECGFLSNRAEAQRLAEKTYQAQLALVISESILENFAEAGNN